MGKVKEWFKNLTDVTRQAEINRLITRAGRRLTRDFRHAIEDIQKEHKYNFYKEKHKMWQEVFWDTSNYRDSLHQTIDLLETQVSILETDQRSRSHTKN